MKSIVMPKTEQLNEKNSSQLSAEVKETLATEAKVKNRKKRNFTVAEMWNRQRNARSASSMIRKWSMN